MLSLGPQIEVGALLKMIGSFGIGAPASGQWAGAMAALLLIFSPLYNAGSHLNTCDVPSAFFAALCLLFVARLIDEERTRDYLLAGIEGRPVSSQNIVPTDLIVRGTTGPLRRGWCKAAGWFSARRWCSSRCSR